jgi:hypothetical protein
VGFRAEADKQEVELLTITSSIKKGQKRESCPGKVHRSIKESLKVDYF